jgi:hypothetical protein
MPAMQRPLEQAFECLHQHGAIGTADGETIEAAEIGKRSNLSICH